MKRLRYLLPLAALLAFLATTPAALAQESARGGYVGPGGNTQSDVGVAGVQSRDDCASRANGDSQACASVRGSYLPFTGLDLGYLGIVGIGLLGLGVFLRRFANGSGTA